MVSHESLCIHLFLLLDQGNIAKIQVRPGDGDRMESAHTGCAGKYPYNRACENYLVGDVI
jgi:hypothetical protein